ncbi:hypothetical protein VPNG_08045 [Cytospora leucostoma]|uniref:LysM domain-containing protein n=1 Tax=Cytospora leucostoma TaxID=1230097 RepID=A0A423WQU6_9PEZI|nr:hypothetical protein VPNG_08045 [Cytospora leucostoma]
MGLIWLRTWYGDGSDAAFSAFNEVRDEETEYPVFQDAQRYNYGEDWKRFFTRAPQMLDPYSTSPVGYESTKQRALEECFQFEVQIKREVEQGGYGIHWMVMYSDYYWKSKVGLIFVADEEMLRAAAQDPESAKVLAVWYDELGRVVRHTRLTVDEASDVEMREQVMRGTNQESNEWLSAQPGEGYETFVLPATQFTTVPSQTAAPNYTTTYLAPTTPLNISTMSASFLPDSISAFASLLVYCPITANDTLDGWTISDLPDDCEDGLEIYCDPLVNATVPTSTSFPVTCSPSYWENLATASVTASSSEVTTGDSTTTTASTPIQTGIATDCDAWNPALGSECQYLIPTYAVCIGVSGSSSSTAGSTSPGPTRTTNTPSPIMTGTDPSCTSYYYVASGDSCYDIEQEYGITSDEFDTWNPSIGSDCSGLWASEYICVGAPYTHIATTSSIATATSTTSTTSTSIATSAVPSPLEPSTWTNCTSYYYVVSGDSCYSIEQEYSITAEEFTEWNPAVGTGCAGLWADVYVCVVGP